MRVNSITRYGYVFALLVGLMAFALTACDIPVDTGSQDKTISGKVVDGKTYVGIAKATVGVKAEGSWSTTTTSDGTTALGNGDGIDTALGDFVISVPSSAGSSLPIYFSADGYINKYGKVSGGNVGDAEMFKGVTITVYVKDSSTGQDVKLASDAPHTIVPSYVYSNVDGIVRVAAAQDATDKAKYTISIPEGGDTVMVYSSDTSSPADGVLDYGSATGTLNSTQLRGGDSTIILNVSKLSKAGGSISIDKNNFNTSNKNSDKYLATSTNVELIFNQPVDAASSTTDGAAYKPRFRYTDDLSLVSAANSSKVDTEVAASVDPSLGNHRYVISPASKLPANMSVKLEQFRVRGYFKSPDNDLRQEFNADQTFRIYYAGTDGIGATSPNISADNSNGCSGGKFLAPNATTTCTGGTDAGGSSGTVKLLFPEPVYGQYRLISYTNGTTTTPDPKTNTVIDPVGALTDFTCTTMAFYAATTDTVYSTNVNNYAYNQTGCATSSIGVSLPDSISGTARSVEVYLDIYDAEGNTFTKTASYSIN